MARRYPRFIILPKKVPAVAATPAALPEPVWSANSPKAQALTVPAEFATLPAKGWMAVKFVATTVGTAVNQYPLTLHNGASTGRMGLRVFTDDTLKPENIKSGTDNGNITALRSIFKAQANEVKTWIYTWDVAAQRQAVLVDGTYAEDLSKIDFAGQAFTTLQIGGRNAGADPLLGYVVSAELGISALTREQMVQKAYPPALSIATGGQSNADNLFSSTFLYNGRNNFKTTMTGLTASAQEINYLNGATGGSSLFMANATTYGYWLNEVTGEYGPALKTFISNTAGLSLDHLHWSQGEADTFGNQTKAEYKAQLLKLFAIFRVLHPNVRITIDKLARRTGAFNGATQQQNIAEAQQEIIDAYSWVNAFETYDLSMSDTVHKDSAGYTIVGQRAAKAINRMNGGNPAGGTKGPKLLSITRAGAVITATLQHDAGTDFTPTTGIDGFVAFDGDIPVSITGITTGSGVAAVTINATAHGLAVGDRLAFASNYTYNGVILRGTYEVNAVTNANAFTVISRNGGATAAGTGGGAATITCNKRIAISSAVRASATTATITLASVPTAFPATLYYGYDAMIGINTANILKDNSVNALPMRRGKVSVT